ncbi:GRP family sugar transporter [Limosilactobacillus equigenerosi]|uniref:Sugar transporter n=1 Tax=Limosilactobacillus equigenerosi DSM 18793 = JCM 14505 TaxID=1423742 RepID=A0A0R1UTT0_9LACO|nr:GRP family sugar transporter [Limosilactobacillus equigenerosi]KRL94883.1 Sugar transporter [Limosilactobacillus equigenerosi DSM 18793 = JCM 14505]
MSYLIGLIPALAWGIMPLLATKAGGTEKHQIFGIGSGALLVAIVTQLVMRPHVSVEIFIFALICGMLWSTAQVGQFIAMKKMGVSKAIPLSTVFQLVGNSIIGTLVFKEWDTVRSITVGFIALAVVVIGALCTSVVDKDAADKVGAVTVSNVLFLLVSTIGYWIYSAFPKIPFLLNAKPEGLFFPQALGIFIGAVLYQLFTGQIKSFKDREQYTNIIAGVAWGCAAIAYIFAGRDLGVNVAFVLTQLNVIIATLGGIIILHEHHSKREMKYTVLGIALIVIGSIMTIAA